MTFGDKLKSVGLGNAIPEDAESNPNEMMLLRAVQALLIDARDAWRIELRSTAPLQLALVGDVPWFDELLSGTMLKTPAGRARTAVAMAFAARVSRMTERHLTMLMNADLSRLDDPAYRAQIFTDRLGFMRKGLADDIKNGGYEGLIRSIGST